MDGLGVESCSSSRSSPSLRSLNLICSGSSQNIEQRRTDSSNSSEDSISPSPSNVTDCNRRLSVNEGSSSRDDAYWEKRRRNNDAAKRSREKRRINDMIMEQKLLELTKENNLLRSRLKQQQEQQQHQQPPTTSFGTVIVSTAQKTGIVASMPTVPSLPVSSVTTLAANLANVVGPPSKLQAMFPAHLFAATPLLPSSSGTVAPILAPPSGTAAAAATSLLTPANAAQAAATQQLPMLQICTLQAALQQNYCSPTGPAIISSGHSAFQPFHNTRDATSTTQSYSPDSSTTDVTPIDYSMHSTTTSHHTELTDPGQFLRYRMLEKQPDVAAETSGQNAWNDQSASASHSLSSSLTSSSSSASEKAKESDPDDKPRSLLGSLLATKRSSPLVAQSRTDTHSGLNCSPPKDNDLKNCLSSLAVNLGTAAATSSAAAAAPSVSGNAAPPETSGGNTAKSDSSDSMESPSSNNSTTDSLRSRTSPVPKNSAIVKALRSRPSSKQQYMDRRRRNNEAAKRCRANRRAQFEYRSKRAQQLETENDELRKEMNRLKQELEQLKALHAAKTAAALQR